MEAIEEQDLAKYLNFSSNLRFVSLVELDLAGLILAAQGAKSNCRLRFRPLKPRYASLVQLTASRFGLKASVRGWGDERYVLVFASPEATLPCVQCTDFVPPGSTGLAPRLRDVAAASAIVTEAPPEAMSEEAATASAATVPSRADRSSGMRGWGNDADDGDEDDDWIAKRRKATAADGRLIRGRGFSNPAKEAEAPSLADDEEATDCRLQNDYSPYEIDPDDTWTPQRKPYVELTDVWEFSGAWSLIPEQHERDEEAACNGNSPDKEALAGPRGVVVFKVEHERGGDFSVAFGPGSSSEARWFLERGGEAGGPEEPFVLEFKLEKETQNWRFRFGRAAKRQDWKVLPWSNSYRTSFWLATLPGDEGKQHIFAGLDEYPERRFFFAKVRLKPRIIGFGPPASPQGSVSNKAFYIRDIALYGRMSLLPPPFASRDHFVELIGKTHLEAMKMCEEAGLGSKVTSIAALDKEIGVLVLCRQAEDAVVVAAALPGSVALRSLEWVWPPKDFASGGSGPAAVKISQQELQECWAKLHVETTRELAIFQEHLDRRVRHLEGVRIARTSATRMILANLKGDAPTPKPPSVGV